MIEPSQAAIIGVSQTQSKSNMDISLKDKTKSNSNFQKTRALTKEEIKTRLISKIKKQQRNKKNHKTICCREKFKTYIKEKFQQQATNDFSCPVCLEMIISPAPTPCGHIFCFKCLEEALIHKSVCPSCRAQIRSYEFPISQNYQKINSHFWKYSTDKNNYKAKIIQNMEWKNKRFIKPEELKIDQDIDARDTEHVWCKGILKQIFYQDGKINEVLVHYNSWNKIYDEVINIKSQRLAPANFFSERTDIPKYRLSQSDDNVRGRISYGNEREQQNHLQLILTSDNNPFQFPELQNNFMFPLNYNRFGPLRISYPRSLQRNFINLNNLNPEDSSMQEEEENNNNNRQNNERQRDIEGEQNFQLLPLNSRNQEPEPSMQLQHEERENPFSIFVLNENEPVYIPPSQNPQRINIIQGQIELNQIAQNSEEISLNQRENRLRNDQNSHDSS